MIEIYRIAWTAHLFGGEMAGQFIIGTEQRSLANGFWIAHL